MWKEKFRNLLKGQKTVQSEAADHDTFSRADLAECEEAIQNPGCGWYHLYTFDASKTDEPLYIACEEEELVLLRIGIGAFASGAIPQKTLDWIRKILAFFRDRKKGMILRFAYDLEGKGLEHEPGSIKIVQEHMRQLGEIIQQFSDDIFAVQGILVGNWGEMHGSRYLTPDGFQTLTRTMAESIGSACPLAVRRPSQWRELAKDWTDGEKERLTLYNDGIFGSETDLGTYGTLAAETPGQIPRTREEELAWQKNAMRGHFCGGEAVQNAEEGGTVSAAEALKDLEKMHISYLNSTYDLRLLERWRKETVNGGSGLEAIGKRLGYRFVVEDVEIFSEKDNQMWKTGENSFSQIVSAKITLENRGFAELTEEADCCLEIEGENGIQERFQINTDARTWNSGEMTVLFQKIKLPAVPEQKKLFLALYRRRDGRPIRFANRAAESGRVFLGTYQSSFSRSSVPSSKPYSV